MWRQSDDHHLQQEGPKHPIVMQNRAAEMNRVSGNNYLSFKDLC